MINGKWFIIILETIKGYLHRLTSVIRNVIMVIYVKHKNYANLTKS